MLLELKPFGLSICNMDSVNTFFFMPLTVFLYVCPHSIKNNSHIFHPNNFFYLGN